MTKEELLAPRYKIIAPYPGMEAEPFHLEQIITLTKNEINEWIHIPIRHIPGSYMREGFFESFPHLFKQLHWAEDRKIEDMPEYLHYVETDANVAVIFKATPGSFRKFMAYGFTTDHEGFVTGFDNIRIDLFVPATKEEYDEYIKRKDGKDE
jgi:hypothetical protein